MTTDGWNLSESISKMYNNVVSDVKDLKNSIKSEMQEDVSIFTSEGVKLINHALSSSYGYDIPNSEICMDIALSDPSKVKEKDYKTVKKDKVKDIVGEKKYMKMKEKLPTSFNNKYPTVEFSATSGLAKALNNSSTMKDIAKEYEKIYKTKNVTLGHAELTREKDSTDLYASLHNILVISPKIENGYFTGYVYDTYDFATMKSDGSKLTELNNYAVKLQDAGIIKNYNILVPIKIKI